MQAQVVSESPLITIGERMNLELGSFLKAQQFESLLIVCDENTHAHCYPLYAEIFAFFSNKSIVVLPAGDSEKNLHNSALIWEALLKLKGGRKSLVIALGGGMICDMCAFAASVFMRGVSFILLPTSLLAMVDASVGGKTAVNFNQLKNIIGTFNNPEAVFIDVDFLKTLPHSEMDSGKAEMLKHSLLEGEQGFISFIENFNFSPSVERIANSIRFKLKITQHDFHEKGIREILNLGHTTAHAFESLYFSKNKVLLHGHAVAAGLWIESFISEGFFQNANKEKLQELRNFISSNYARIEVSLSEADDLIELMKSDKKNKSGSTSFVLLTSPGNPLRDCFPDDLLIRQSIQNYISNA
ncbi:MAG: 3-dehydroquinate synthase family protein [Bacteroidia bacterium]